ncbi:hypothetical protein BDV28DRAFT_131570 [Aspergillus coremiiformis]|uniref:Uncharacterized protein n=1 Tax=Aspergillus coremiiformis TaxID=138285 RepID=A0A5N6Z949_9EURO|nr:hypothetical protein BDV28DRAFT_131570 [Aspergillus coremiiformis]
MHLSISILSSQCCVPEAVTQRTVQTPRNGSRWPLLRPFDSLQSRRTLGPDVYLNLLLNLHRLGHCLPLYDEI